MSQTPRSLHQKCDSPQPLPLRFMHHQNHSHEERKRNAYQTRAHIIHLNRRTAAKSASTSASRNKDGRPLAPASLQAAKSKPGPDETTPQNPSQHTLTTAAIPRTISPTFGPLTVTSSDRYWEPASLEIAAHLSKVLWPSMCGKRGSAEWLDEFFSNSAAFHSFTLQGLMHLDFLRNTTSVSISRTAISHMIKAIAALREMIGRSSTLNPSGIETCIHITPLLARNEILPAHLSTDHVLLFVPRFPRANQIHI